MDKSQEVTPPPFDEWATVSISDSGSEDEVEGLGRICTLEEEAREREIEAVGKRLEEAAEQLAVQPVPISQPPMESGEDENQDLLDALRKYLPAMEEEISLYEEYAVMKHLGERLRS